MVAPANHLVTGPIPSVSSAVRTGKAIVPKVSPYSYTDENDDDDRKNEV